MVGLFSLSLCGRQLDYYLTPRAFLIFSRKYAYGPIGHCLTGFTLLHLVLVLLLRTVSIFSSEAGPTDQARTRELTTTRPEIARHPRDTLPYQLHDPFPAAMRH
jgi:hypothetical protein